MKAFLVLALVAFVNANPLTRPAPAPETPMVQIIINLKEGETSHVVDIPVALPAPVDPIMPLPLPVDPIMPLPLPVDPIMPLPLPVDPIMPLPLPVHPIMPLPAPEMPIMPLPAPIFPVQPLPVEPELMPSEDLYEPGFLRPGVPLIY